MLFQTLHYAIFLILVVGLYWSSPYKYRLHILESLLIFYGSWSVNYLPLLVGVAVLAWGLGRLFSAQRSPNAPRWQYILALIALFIPLGFFKYWDWIIETIVAVVGYFGVPLEIPRSKDFGVILPVGISFFTFQAASYLVDVRRNGEEENNPWRFVTFLAFFRNDCWSHRSTTRVVTPNKTIVWAKTIWKLYLELPKVLSEDDLCGFMYHSIIEQSFADPISYRGIELWTFYMPIPFGSITFRLYRLGHQFSETIRYHST